MNTLARWSTLLVITSLQSVALGSELQQRIANQWFGTDEQRIEFVGWVNREQPFVGLDRAEVAELLGQPSSIYDNQEYPYNGMTTRLDETVVANLPDGMRRPEVWMYQTLRPGTKESEEWSGEGSGYLLDLIIQFNVDGRVYGCGTNQFTTGGDYYELLDSLDQ